jgi:hypothetical protein
MKTYMTTLCADYLFFHQFLWRFISYSETTEITVLPVFLILAVILFVTALLVWEFCFYSAIQWHLISIII